MEAIRIIQGCKENQPWAQKALFEQLAPSMIMVCRRYTGNLPEAEEVMLSGFMQFFLKIHLFEYRGEGSISAYLRRIMIHESLMHLRKQPNITEQEIEDTLVSEEQDPLDRLSTAEIMELITRLPTGYRTIFNLYVIDGMSHREIADLLHIKEGTSKSQLSKARRLLQQMVIKINNHGITT